MRFLRISTLLFLSAQANISLSGIAVDLDYACFRGRDSLVFVEVFASLQQSQLDYTKTDSGFVAHFRLITELTSDGMSIASDTLDGFDTVTDSSDLKPGRFFPHVITFYMKPGRYSVFVTLENGMDSVLERNNIILDVKPFPEDSLALSDIELACLVEKSDDVTRFWKNGLRVLPNPVKFFGTQLPLFYYYCEFYNFRYSPEVPDSFIVERQIRSEETGRIAKRFPPKVKKKAGTTAVEADGFPISILHTGTYRFEIRVTDLYDNTTAQKHKRFWIYRPEDFEAGREGTRDTLFTERLEKYKQPVEIENPEVALDQMRYILTSEELARVRRLNSEGKIQFLWKYWEEKALKSQTTPEIARWNYFRRVEEANRSYSYLKKEGWRTDRGRIYIQLGPPDLIDYNTSRPDISDYEIWYYDRIEGGVEFVFADKSGFGDLDIVHSTKRGEFYDTNWFKKLTGRPLSDPGKLTR